MIILFDSVCVCVCVCIHHDYDDDDDQTHYQVTSMHLFVHIKWYDNEKQYNIINIIMVMNNNNNNTNKNTHITKIKTKKRNEKLITILCHRIIKHNWKKKWKWKNKTKKKNFRPNTKLNELEIILIWFTMNIYIYGSKPQKKNPDTLELNKETIFIWLS